MVVSFRDLGSGPTLVCHPGGPGFSGNYLGDLGRLDRDLRLVLVDPRGTGRTPPATDRSAYRFEDYVADLDDLRASLGLEALDLLGHSGGGWVALRYALAHPSRVRRLVLCEMLLRPIDPPPWSGYFARFGQREEAFTQVVGRPNTDALTAFRREIRPTLDVEPLLSSVFAPTLVVVGGEGLIVPVEMARRTAETLPRGELAVVPGAGHFPWLEDPSAFRAAVAAFLLAANGPQAAASTMSEDDGTSTSR